MAGGPVITLLTDFGAGDSHVAEVKGVRLARALPAAARTLGAATGTVVRARWR